MPPNKQVLETLEICRAQIHELYLICSHKLIVLDPSFLPSTLLTRVNNFTGDNAGALLELCTNAVNYAYASLNQILPTDITLQKEIYLDFCSCYTAIKALPDQAAVTFFQTLQVASQQAGVFYDMFQLRNKLTHQLQLDITSLEQTKAAANGITLFQFKNKASFENKVMNGQEAINGLTNELAQICVSLLRQCAAMHNFLLPYRNLRDQSKPSLTAA